MQAARFSGWWRTEAIEYQIGVGEGSGEEKDNHFCGLS